MVDNRESADRGVHDVPTNHPIKLDQVRNVTGGTLLRTIPVSQQTRFMMATPLQSSSTAIISTTSTIQAQVLPKVQGATAANQISRMSSGGVGVAQQSSSTTVAAAGYHVPRGAAAVANIALPRASAVASPMVRVPTTLQTINLATPATHPIPSNLASTTPIVGRSVVGVTPWVTTSLAATAQQVSARQTPPPVAATQHHQVSRTGAPLSAAQQIQIGSGSGGTTRLAATTQIKSVGGSESSSQQLQQQQPATKPVLLHTTAHKQITLAQQPQLQGLVDGSHHTTSEKTVMGKGCGNASLNRGPTSATAPLNRITAALPVALQPAVIVPKGSAPAHTKVIATQQQSHGAAAAATVHIPSVPVSSVQPAIAINTVVSRSTGLLPTNPSMRINSVMVVDSSRVQVHPFVSAAAAAAAAAVSEGMTVVAESGVTSAAALGSLSLSGSIGNHNLLPKQNTSPRPSILRKRDPPEGSPLKAQKNLTPVLASMASSNSVSSNCSVSPPPPQTAAAPGSPRIPDGGSGHSSCSAGSTTLSANSSPGESPPIKLEGQEDQHEPSSATTTTTISINDRQPTSAAAHSHNQGYTQPPASTNTTTSNNPATGRQHQEMSPRKKPRKQQLTGNQMTEPAFSEDDMEFISEEKIKIESKLDEIVEKSVAKRTAMSLLNGYRHPWKSRNNHFLRYSDVRPKEERKPTLSELANQKHALQKLNGWKIYHLNSQMEDMLNSETEFFGLYTSLLTSLEIKQKKCKNKDMDREINRVNERIRANFQRSKVLKDQIQEAKLQVMKLFEHKGYVADIISRNVTKRPLKKRDRI